MQPRRGFVIDIDKATDDYDINLGSGDFTGAVVAEIKSPPNMRINDVIVHTITFQNKPRDALIVTDEKCGSLKGSGKRQRGQGGSSVYDVTVPTKSKALKQHTLKSEIHNTFIRIGDSGSAQLFAVNGLVADDVITVDVSKQLSLKEVGHTGVGD